MLVAGCGGGDENGNGSATGSGAEPASSSKPGEGSGNGPPGETGEGVGIGKLKKTSMSKAQFVKRANAACGQEKSGRIAQMEAYALRHRKEGKPESELFADLTTTLLLPTVEAESLKIAALGAPMGEEKEIEAFLDAQQEGIEEVAAMPDIKTFEEFEAAFAKAGKLMKAYGVFVCDNGPAPPPPPGGVLPPSQRGGGGEKGGRKGNGE